MNSSDDLPKNLRTAHSLIEDAATDGASMACLPEVFTCMCNCLKTKRKFASDKCVAEARAMLSKLALRHGMYIVGGSIGVLQENKLMRNRSFMFAPDGEEVAYYDKMHLFCFSGSDQKYDESNEYEAGDKVVCCKTNLGKVGMSICYDLRFPELYRNMCKPDLILVPAAFTNETGRAHWELLLRARAVENQCYVAGVAQCGTHPGNLQSWGHSMLVDPWGKVVTSLENLPGVAVSEINLSAMHTTRRRLPSLQSRIL